MSRKYSKQYNAQRNHRLSWIADQIKERQSDAMVVKAIMRNYPGTNEKTARAELKEVYDKFHDLNSDNADKQNIKFLEMGFALLEEMRAAGYYGPIPNLYKTLAGIAGVVTERAQVDQHVIPVAPAPKAELVRDRITKLANDPKIRERAKKLGLDLAELENDPE